MGVFQGRGQKLIKLIFGNHYEPIENPRGHYKDDRLMMAHRWMTFLSLDNNTETTHKYIKKVVYYLHPAYKVNRIELTEHAYMLSRTAFGTFVIGCEIIF